MQSAFEFLIRFNLKIISDQDHSSKTQADQRNYKQDNHTITIEETKQIYCPKRERPAWIGKQE